AGAMREACRRSEDTAKPPVELGDRPEASLCPCHVWLVMTPDEAAGPARLLASLFATGLSSLPACPVGIWTRPTTKNHQRRILAIAENLPGQIVCSKNANVKRERLWPNGAN